MWGRRRRGRSVARTLQVEGEAALKDHYQSAYRKEIMRRSRAKPVAADGEPWSKDCLDKFANLSGGYIHCAGEYDPLRGQDSSRQVWNFRRTLASGMPEEGFSVTAFFADFSEIRRSSGLLSFPRVTSRRESHRSVCQRAIWLCFRAGTDCCLQAKRE